jgi:hemolysin activation/secretion protein
MTVRSALATMAGLFCASGAAAQTVLDRVEPTRVEETAQPDDKPPANAPAVTITPSSAAARVSPVFVGAIVLSGLTMLRAADFSDIVQTYVGRTLSPADLGQLSDAVAGRARARGLVLASATIPPQPIASGVLRIAVEEGHVDEIRFDGPENRSVRASLAPLIGSGPVTLARLERHLLVAGDVDGIWLRGTRLVREGGRNVLEVRIGVDRFAATVALDNSGSRPIGPIQGDVVARIAHILADDDVLALSGLLTPTQPDEFGFARLRYTKRVSAAGTELSGSVSAARTHPGAYLRSRDIQGDSWTASLGVLHPVLRSRAASLWLEGSLGVRRTRQERQDVLARRDRLTVARVGVYGFADVPGGRLRSSATLSQGLDLFDPTRRGDPLASRSDADGTFTSLTLTADWTGPIVPDVTLQVAFATQVAAQPLLVAEETGIGGGQFLRAYDYSELSGDQGTMGAAELRWAAAPKLGPVRKPVLYAFVDGGRVTNLRRGFGTGTLFSTGAGLRMDLADLLNADVGIAVPLSGERYDSGNSRPVVNFRLTHRF